MPYHSPVPGKERACVRIPAEARYWGASSSAPSPQPSPPCRRRGGPCMHRRDRSQRSNFVPENSVAVGWNVCAAVPNKAEASTVSAPVQPMPLNVPLRPYW